MEKKEKNVLKIASQSSLKPDNPQESTNPEKWGEVSITFLSEERIQVEVAELRNTYDYAEFGLIDQRSKNPTKSWETLRLIAEANGTLRAGGSQRLKLEKRIQEIRRALRERFRISADPIRHVRIAVSKPGWRPDQRRPDKPPHQTERNDPLLRHRGIEEEILETRLYRAQFRIACGPSYRF